MIMNLQKEFAQLYKNDKALFVGVIIILVVEILVVILLSKS